MKPAVLYISYDGMLEPLGQSQVLAYLDHLAKDYQPHLISFEKKNDWEDEARREEVRARIAAAGIVWKPLRYHKSPTAPATAFDIAAGTVAALTVARRHSVTIVHARSYVAAAMALPVKRLTGARFLFDMRGFWADERVDGGIWPAESRKYKVAKRLERNFLLAADHVVTLTDASAVELGNFPYLKGQMPPVSVIPTCADLDQFSLQLADRRGQFVLGYVGSVGTWYLFDELLVFFRALREKEPQAQLLIINRNEHAFIRERVALAGLSPDCIEIIAADHSEVPAQIARMTVGSAIIKPAYSKIASAPTKLAEYLGCGVPCLGNVGVGDMEQILEGRRVGIALRGFSPADMAEAVDRLLSLTGEPNLQVRCSQVARQLFSLESGVAAYRSIYQKLSPPPVQAQAPAGPEPA